MSRIYIKTITAVNLLISLISCTSVLAQGDFEYGAKLDTNIIIIGDQINMKLSIKQPKEIKIDFPAFKDSITSNIEILQQFAPDTIPQKDGMLLITKNFTLTSFDGGVHKIPPMEFTIHQQNFVNVVRTDTLLLGVNTFEIDTTKANFDIMMPYNAPISFIEAAPWAIGALLLAGLVVLLILYLRKRKRNEPLFRMPKKPQEPAHVIALRKLDELKSKNLWQIGKMKEYHTQLTDTLRIYLEERFYISAMEQTSDEILGATKGLDDLDNEQQINLKDILYRADLVKFAKLQPLADENDKSLKDAYLLVNKTIKEEVEEIEESEEVEEPEEMTLSGKAKLLISKTSKIINKEKIISMLKNNYEQLKRYLIKYKNKKNKK